MDNTEAVLRSFQGISWSNGYSIVCRHTWSIGIAELEP
jgi:hypothetical protein